ncbi:MAG: hypothetical protein RBR82_15990 [Pseudomonas sp.]|nr:hypothetical protein [Pseudomonas sp.]
MSAGIKKAKDRFARITDQLDGVKSSDSTELTASNIQAVNGMLLDMLVAVAAKTTRIGAGVSCKVSKKPS